MSNIASRESGLENTDGEDLQKVKQEFYPLVKEKIMLVGFPVHYAPSSCLALTSCIRMPAAMRLSMSSLRSATKVLAVISPLTLPDRQGPTINLNLAMTTRPSSRN